MPGPDLLRKIEQSRPFRQVIDRLAGGERRLGLVGLTPSAAALICAAIFDRLAGLRYLLLVTPGVESAERATGECATFAGAGRVIHFPCREILPGEDLDPPPEITGRRLQALHALGNAGGARIVVTPVQALLGPVIPPRQLAAETLTLETGQALARKTFLEELFGAGYQRVELVTAPGEFAVRGGIIDFYPATPWPVRLETAGTRIFSLRYFDPSSQLSRESVTRLTCLPFREEIKRDRRPASLLDYLASTASPGPATGPTTVIAALETEQIETEAAAFHRAAPGAGRRPPASLPGPGPSRAVLHFTGHGDPAREAGGTSVPFPAAGVDAYSLKGALPNADWAGQPIHIFCRNESQGRRLRELLAERGLALHPDSRIETGFIAAGFSLPGTGITVLADADIFGRYRQFRPAASAFYQSTAIGDPREIKPGDYVVHLNEGIGRFLGVGTLENGPHREEVLRIEYADGVILTLPVNQVSLVHRFTGGEKPPALSRLGGRGWIRTRERARRSIRDMASDLIRIYQGRRGGTGTAFPADTPWQKAFEAEFVWTETPDQARAITAVKRDLEATRPMDRLICGDVGYGKTEVAMRAAFKVAESGRQVALLCPTTILCQQHLHTFRERFADYPLVIDNLSRFRGPAEQKEVLARLAAGRIDIIIGTHRLLSRDIRFHDLGLWIVDEEQRFGVVQKEKLRAAWPGIDILTMSATPIPRTMQLSLGGIRDLSVIETPPAGRQAVLTFVAPWRRELVLEACRRELERDGQVFFVHNRVHNIARVAAQLQALLPEAEIAVCHGQMAEKELAAIMERFLERRVDILVATTIIESGLDIPNANTIIINNSQHFGLAELYQLRGRVGRYRSQAYCYLLYQPGAVLTEEGRRRLRAIEEFQRLGSGFRLAMADLEIRGAGNILGREQHGFIEAIGFYLYSHLFREAVAALTGKPEDTPPPPEQVNGTLSAEHIPPETLRLSFYRRLFGLSESADALARELTDRFGPLPEETRRLLKCFRPGGDQVCQDDR